MLTKRDVLKSAAALPLMAGAMGLEPLLAQERPTARPSGLALQQIATEGYIFGLPIVMNYAIMFAYALDRASGQFKAPFNVIANEHRVFTYEDTTVVTPNSDTPYSFMFADLRAEPLVLSVPAVEPQRYYSVMLCDASTYNYGYIGSRATGHEAGDYLIAGPDWNGEVPPGIKKVFRSGAQFSLILYRTQLFDPADMANVIAIQAGYKSLPLSAYLHQSTPSPAPAIAFPKIDQALAKTNFFDYLDFMLHFIPPQPNEADIRAKLARIGVGPGKQGMLAALSEEDRHALVLGMAEGARQIDLAAANAGVDIHGWRVSSAGGDAAQYNGDWLKRAFVARAGIYANDAAEAMYPMTRHDLSGQLLDGAKHAYTLTFAAGQLPPVNAFWSITMYDAQTQLLVKNPLGRYLINSPMLPQLKTNADGSLTLYIQNASPGADKEANWLPAPAGPIYLVMRLYWPKSQPPSILPPGKGTWQPPGVIARA